MKIYLFYAKAGSGKDTSALLLQEILEESGLRVKTYAFGASLKKITLDLTQLYTGVSYDLIQMDDLEYKEKIRDDKIFVQGEERPLVLRTLLQQIGTNILRQHLGPDIFANSVVEKIDSDEKSIDVALITDLRFPNEEEVVKKYCVGRGFQLQIVKIERDVSQNSHESESYYEKFEPDFIISNNGTLDDLKKQLRLI